MSTDLTQESARAETKSPRIGLGAVVFDCPDPRALAEFYSRLLGVPVAAGSDDDWVDLERPGSRLSFQKIDEYVAPVWPVGAPQQAHLDLEVAGADMPAAHDWAVSLGATPLDPTEPPQPGDTRGYRVYADPAGHPFCLCGCADPA